MTEFMPIKKKNENDEADLKMLVLKLDGIPLSIACKHSSSVSMRWNGSGSKNEI